MSGDRRLVDMTVSELRAVLSEFEMSLVERIGLTGLCRDAKRFEHGLEGIQRIYKCSKSTASRIKKSGVIDAAISQFGRKITIDVNKALAIKPNL